MTKTINTILKSRYDTFNNWNATNVSGRGGNTVLMAGEIGICYVPGGSGEDPTILMKVGDGVNPFSDLPWVSGLSYDVHDWAKSENCPAVDTDTQYRLIADGQNKVKLQSKTIGGSWTDAGHTLELVQDATNGRKIGFKTDGTAPTTWLEIPEDGLSAHVTDTTVHVTSTEKSAWNEKYAKPANGIPISDLSAAVQAALDAGADFTPYRTASAQDAIDATKASTSDLTAHTGNSTVHISASDRTSWSAKYDKPSAGIPKTDLSSAVQASLNLADSALQDHQDISGKLDAPSGGSVGQVLKKTASGVEWGDTSGSTDKVSYSDKLSQITGVMSDAEKVTLWGRQTIVKTAMDAIAVAGASYYLGEIASLTVTLPETALAGQEILVVFYSGATATSLTVSGDTIGDVPTPAVNQRVEVSFLYDGVMWCVLSNCLEVPSDE